MTYKNREVLALVPARGGSKGVSRKNLRLIKGKPLIEYSIQAAMGSKVVDQVYVSSDDDEILSVGSSLDAKCFKRSDVASSDISTAASVVFDFIYQLPLSLVKKDPIIIYLQPTSPLRNSSHIDEAFSKMEAGNAFCCISVVQLKRSPYKSFTISKSGLLKPLFDEYLSNANRQSLTMTYYPNGALYIFPLSEFLNKKGFPSSASIPYIMSENDSIDIDTEEDISAIERL
jgi:CMP-N-acetylneuraminic acid synthetase